MHIHIYVSVASVETFSCIYIYLYIYAIYIYVYTCIGIALKESGGPAVEAPSETCRALDRSRPGTGHLEIVLTWLCYGVPL